MLVSKTGIVVRCDECNTLCTEDKAIGFGIAGKYFFLCVACSDTVGYKISQATSNVTIPKRCVHSCRASCINTKYFHNNSTCKYALMTEEGGYLCTNTK